MHEIERFFSNEGSRNKVRTRVIKAFLDEKPGEGTGKKTSQYIYFVERLQSGQRVYLKRPAKNYYGFDFLICVEDANYAKRGENKRNSPRHDDISEDLKKKKKKDPDMYAKLYKLLRKVYKCKDVTDEEMEDIQFSSGLPVDHILKVIKWMFIEQDIRYWNYSGRKMTWSIVPDP